MLPATSRQMLWRVMALRTIELISLLCMLHWTMHFFWTPTPSPSLTYAAEQYSEPAQAVDYRHELWAIALATNALLYLPMKSLATLTERELQSQPLSMAVLKPLLLVLLLALAQLVLLVAVHLMTT